MSRKAGFDAISAKLVPRWMKEKRNSQSLCVQGGICADPSLPGGSLTSSVLFCREIRVTPGTEQGKVQPWAQQSPGVEGECSGSAGFCPAAGFLGISDLRISRASLGMHSLQMELLPLKVF